MATPKTVALHTLGCKLNFSETSLLRRRLESSGYAIVPFNDAADIYVLNTCSVTDFADRKCRAAIRKAKRNNEDSKVIVTGCYAQLKPEEIAEIDGVNLVLGAAEKFRIAEYIDELSIADSSVHCSDIAEIREFEGSYSFGDRTRTFLKVQDGCDYTCSFCTIPMARGASRSMPIDDVSALVSDLAMNTETKEIVLTGINLGDYGLFIDGAGKKSRKNSFLDLIKKLDEVKDIDRFRISSIEPNLCSNEIIEFVANSERFMPHFHMPLQSGSDEILGKMRRRYRSDVYRERVSLIKKVMPYACIGVDVIVGFPGETDEHFDETLRFLESQDVSYFHVFTYSERGGTVAETMVSDKVDMHIRRKRNAILRALSEDKKRSFYQKFDGQLREVLLEDKVVDGMREGFTDNYIRVSVPENMAVANQRIALELNYDKNENKMIGKLVSESQQSK